MQTSPEIKQIAPALLKAQMKIGGAFKGKTNPFFKSKYADLGSVMETCKEALNDNGISVLQPVGSENGVDFVETILIHTSGEWMASKMTLRPNKQNDPQAQGSALTYNRRYSLQSMVFIPAEDDDGEKATSHEEEPEQHRHPDSGTIKFIPTKINADAFLSKAGKNCVSFKIHTPDGLILETMDRRSHDLAETSVKLKRPMTVTYQKTQYGYNITSADIKEEAGA